MLTFYKFCSINYVRASHAAGSDMRKGSCPNLHQLETELEPCWQFNQMVWHGLPQCESKRLAQAYIMYSLITSYHLLSMVVKGLASLEVADRH